MPELEEFTDSLFAQLDVELNEEKEIKQLVNKIKDDTDFTIKFDSLEDVSNQIFPQLKQKISEFMEIDVSPKVKVSYASLDEFKKSKGAKGLRCRKCKIIC